mmetsp:Transcript_15574/g.48191  ORF Transcript_15574/g.48191 Transcript_15574/m.48191 type:complete len:203 (-) Transcript_15574:790-1398(-)
MSSVVYGRGSQLLLDEVEATAVRSQVLRSQTLRCGAPATIVAARLQCTPRCCGKLANRILFQRKRPVAERAAGERSQLWLFVCIFFAGRPYRCFGARLLRACLRSEVHCMLFSRRVIVRIVELPRQTGEGILHGRRVFHLRPAVLANQSLKESGPIQRLSGVDIWWWPNLRHSGHVCASFVVHVLLLGYRCRRGRSGQRQRV